MKNYIQHISFLLLSFAAIFLSNSVNAHAITDVEKTIFYATHHHFTWLPAANHLPVHNDKAKRETEKEETEEETEKSNENNEKEFNNQSISFFYQQHYLYTNQISKYNCFLRHYHASSLSFFLKNHALRL